MKSEILRLQDWFESQCDKDWEHGNGIKIKTLDNPGWSLDIELDGTILIDKELSEYKENYEHETDWITCKKEGSIFQGRGGPKQLLKIIQFFLDWAK